MRNIKAEWPYSDAPSPFSNPEPSTHTPCATDHPKMVRPHVAILAACLCGVLAAKPPRPASDHLPLPMPRGNTSLVFSHGEGGYPCIRIPAVVLAGGVLVAFAEARILNCCDFGPKRLALTRSWDSGKSWESQRTVLVDKITFDHC